MNIIEDFEDDYYEFDDSIEDNEEAGLYIPNLLYEFKKKGHLFNIPENVCGLFLSSIPPKNCFKVMKLPFRIIYLNVKLPLEKGFIDGIILRQKVIEPEEDEDYFQETWIPIIYGENSSVKLSLLNKEEKKEFYDYVFEGEETDILFRFRIDDSNIEYEERNLFFEGRFEFTTKDLLRYDEYSYELPNLKKWRDFISKKEWNIIENFVMNFCCFCNDPRVTLITRKLSEDIINKRERRNQSIAPNIVQTVITDDLRKYIFEKNDFFKSIYNLRNRKKKYLLTYKYWVRGHYRKLRHERFKNKRGIVMWISPFTRGEGLEIKQLFSLFHKNEVRKIREKGLKGDQP